jgi:hypothetical protein
MFSVSISLFQTWNTPVSFLLFVGFCNPVLDFDAKESVGDDITDFKEIIVKRKQTYKPAVAIFLKSLRGGR